MARHDGGGGHRAKELPASNSADDRTQLIVIAALALAKLGLAKIVATPSFERVFALRTSSPETPFVRRVGPLDLSRPVVMLRSSSRAGLSSALLQRKQDAIAGLKSAHLATS